MGERSHIACPDDNCGSSDAYSWNEEREVGHCMSCDIGTWMFQGSLWAKHGKNGKPWVLKENAEGMEDIFDDGQKTKPVVTNGTGFYAEFRGIKGHVREFYGVKQYHTPNRVEYKYPSGGIKTRYIDEKSFSAKGLHSDELFGMNHFPAGSSKYLVITEGEEDAMAAYQMLSHNGYTTPCVSLPTATPKKIIWEKCFKWLDSYEKIVLSLDNDGKADHIKETLFDLFPNKIYVMDHGDVKDANDFLLQGKQKSYRDAWWKAKEYSPAGFVASVEDWFDALENETPYEYTPTPIKGFNEINRGLVKGGITVFKALPGTGKSSMLRMLQHDLVVSHGKTVAVLMMEEMKSTTGRAMATYELGKNVMTREDAERNGVGETEVKEALRAVVGDRKFVSFDINPQNPVEDTLRQCKYAVAVYGAEYIFVDHLQRLAYLGGTENATSALTELGVKLTEFAKRKNVGIMCISHVNQDGKTKYASSIEEEAIMIIEMARDKQSDDPREQNTTYLNTSKNRPFALTGPCGMLMYDKDTTMVSERFGVATDDSSVFDDPIASSDSYAPTENTVVKLRTAVGDTDFGF